MTRWLAHSLVLFAFVVCLAGCATFSAGPSSEADIESGDGGMSPSRLELIFASQVPAIEGPTGAIRTQIDGLNVWLITDPDNDRMQILAPIAVIEGIDRRIMNVLLEANFHNTLDARYAVSEGAIYAVYLHQISSLTPEQIESALRQIVSLAKTFGTSFSAGPPRFGYPGSNLR